MENTSLIFNIEYEEIDLTDMIFDDDVKKILKDSKNLIINNKHKESLELLGIAFKALISNYEENKKGMGRSPFFIGENLSHIHSFRNITDERDRDIQDLIRTVQALQQIMKPLCLNIDYRKYVKFRIYTPDIITQGNTFYDKYNVIWLGTRKNLEFTKHESEYCYDFIIECALKLQDFDFEIEDNLPHSFHRIF